MSLLTDIWNIMLWLETGIESYISVPPLERVLNDDLEQYIRSQSSASDLDSSFSFQNSNSISDITGIKHIINNFDNTPRFHHSTNVIRVLEYFNKK